MPAKRLLAHYKIDPQTNRLLMVACNAEDMLLPDQTSLSTVCSLPITHFITNAHSR